MKLCRLATVISIALYGVSVSALSQENPSNEAARNVEASDTPQVELIEVTSQRRVQNIQDVPISVQAFGAAQLERASIDKIEDLQLYVPNLNLAESGLSTQLFIRGKTYYLLLTSSINGEND